MFVASGADARVDMYASIRGSRVDDLRERYRMSVRTAVGRAAGEVERLRRWRGIDFNKVEKSDFKVLSESFKPRMSQ